MTLAQREARQKHRHLEVRGGAGIRVSGETCRRNEIFAFLRFPSPAADTNFCTGHKRMPKSRTEDGFLPSSCSPHRPMSLAVVRIPVKRRARPVAGAKLERNLSPITCRCCLMLRGVPWKVPRYVQGESCSCTSRNIVNIFRRRRGQEFESPHAYHFFQSVSSADPAPRGSKCSINCVHAGKSRL
jgi:hypothetical protein